MTIHRTLTILALAGATAALGACALEGAATDDAHAADDAHATAHAGATPVTGAAAAARPAASEDPRHVVVWQSPSCGCCGDWVTHMKEAGFTVEVRKRNDTRAIKEQHRLPRWSWSCHTAEVGGKIVEGHVPADLVDRMLAEADPAVVGIVVPGMPAGSPGMPDAPGRPLYDVLQLDARGELTRWVQR